MSTGQNRNPPRSRTKLEEAVKTAETAAGRASAHYELGVFHDNNGREKEAIPHYEAALKLGLSGERKAQCLAWLASSLCKTRKFDKAEARLEDARTATSDSDLLSFLQRLERRIKREESNAYLRATVGLLLKLAKAERRKG